MGLISGEWARDGRRPIIAGVELGGTKCVCTLAAGPDEIIACETIPTSAPAVALPAIRAVLDSWQRGHGFAALGIASFGPIGLNAGMAGYGHILATNKPGWASANVLGALAGGSSVPTALDTDVNGAALAEIKWGAGRGLSDFAYVTIGTGVGVGLIVHGHPTRGIGHNELGHLRVPRLPGDDLRSGCAFHDDCVEGLASGSAIKAALGERHVADVDADDPIWNRVAAAVACLCHAIVCATGPHRIAIGGGVIDKQPHLLARIEPLLRRSLNGYLRLPDRGPYIVAPGLGELAGSLGPIAMAIDALPAASRERAPA